MPRVRIAAAGEPEISCIEAEIASLREFDHKTLRAQWRTVFGREAAAAVSRHLLFATLAYRLQADVMGDLDAGTVRFLKQMDTTSSKQATVSLTQAFEERRRVLSPGTVLTREWNGQHHTVRVLDSGFGWQGRTYSSLSEIAKTITGTKWNGPRFFGLREKKSAEAAR